MPLPLLTSVKNIASKLLDQWGREADKSSWNWGRQRPLPPQENPDDTTSDTYYDFSLNPQVVAGGDYADISQVFVSARGICDKDTGEEIFKPQLVWTTPELAGDAIFDLVGWQFDEEIIGGFSEVIRSTDSTCKSYGHVVVEYEWYIREKEPFKGKAFVKRVYTRDPERYRYDIDGKSGIYQDTGFGKWKRMNPQNFQAYAYKPLFNNPYGTSINLPLKPWLETFNKIFGYWRHAIEIASAGSWGASCPDAWFSKDEVGAEMRDAVEEAIKKIAAGTWSVFPESMALENYKLQIEAQAFLDWYTAFCEIVSLIYTGTTGALKEEEYGARAAKESTDVREKSQRERMNAYRVSAFWTYGLIPLLCALNFKPSQIRSTPTLQLIPPSLMMPTTPEGQDTAGEVAEKEGQEKQEKVEVKSKEKKKEKENESKELMKRVLPGGSRVGKSYPHELQEGDEEKPYTPPVAIPPTYEDFPSEEPLPSDYRDVIEEAQAYLESMPVKEYKKVRPGEAHQVFTIKQLRSYEGIETPHMTWLLTDLKQAIIPTLESTEATAWKLYWQQAVKIFQNYGFEQPSPQLRGSLIASFRQARQNALNEGMCQSALNDPFVVGLRIMNSPHVKKHHLTHPLWHNIALPKDHQELQVGGRLRIPMDFGCVCFYEKVYNTADLTPESAWPAVYPGKTYEYYAQPGSKEGEPD